MVWMKHYEFYASQMRYWWMGVEDFFYRLTKPWRREMSSAEAKQAALKKMGW